MFVMTLYSVFLCTLYQVNPELQEVSIDHPSSERSWTSCLSAMAQWNVWGLTSDEPMLNEGPTLAYIDHINQSNFMELIQASHEGLNSYSQQHERRWGGHTSFGECDGGSWKWCQAYEWLQVPEAAQLPWMSRQVHKMNWLRDCSCSLLCCRGWTDKLTRWIMWL